MRISHLLLGALLLLATALPVAGVIEPPVAGSTIPPITEPPTPHPTQPPLLVQHNLYFPVAGSCYTADGIYLC